MRGNTNARACVDREVAYQPHVSLKARSSTIAIVIAVHLAVLIALLNLSGTSDTRNSQLALSTISFIEPLPLRPTQPHRKAVRLRPKMGRSAPRAIDHQAAQVAVPRARIEMPKVQPIAATQTVGAGSAQVEKSPTGTQPETGAGGAARGSGNGTGGSGSGGEGGAIEPPQLVTPVLSGRDFSRDQRQAWPRGATIFLRLRIDPQGQIAGCMIDRGTGINAIDGAICSMAHDRLSFRPALGPNGQNVAGWFGYAQPAPR